MPSRNAVREYVEGGYYHVYNRGVARQAIFNDQVDYQVYLNLLESYFTPKPRADKQEFNPKDPFWRSKLPKDEVKLLAFALMPNHFHFLFHQETIDGVPKFMLRVSAAYTKYFNKKYERVGTLYQGKFKAAKIETDDYLLHLSRYIHLNPLELAPRGLTGQQMFDWLARFEYSSYPSYLGIKKVDWVEKTEILGYFEGNLSRFDNVTNYKQFVESYANQPETILGEFSLDGPIEKSEYTYTDAMRDIL